LSFGLCGCWEKTQISSFFNTFLKNSKLCTKYSRKRPITRTRDVGKLVLMLGDARNRELNSNDTHSATDSRRDSMQESVTTTKTTTPFWRYWLLLQILACYQQRLLLWFQTLRVLEVAHLREWMEQFHYCLLLDSQYPQHQHELSCIPRPRYRRRALFLCSSGICLSLYLYLSFSRCFSFSVLDKWGKLSFVQSWNLGATNHVWLLDKIKMKEIIKYSISFYRR